MTGIHRFASCRNRIVLRMGGIHEIHSGRGGFPRHELLKAGREFSLSRSIRLAGDVPGLLVDEAELVQEAMRSASAVCFPEFELYAGYDKGAVHIEVFGDKGTLTVFNDFAASGTASIMAPQPCYIGSTIEQGGADRVFNSVRLSIKENRVLFGGKATTRIQDRFFL